MAIRLDSRLLTVKGFRLENLMGFQTGSEKVILRLTEKVTDFH
jgi:hypothetical protein